MDAVQKSRRNLIQNITIILLSISAILLFAQTQLLSGTSGASEGYFPEWGNPAGSEASDLSHFSIPVRLAVTGAYGRYAGGMLRSSEEAFSVPGALLGAALQSAGDFENCSQEEFYAALDPSSVYFELDQALPLSILAQLTGAEVSRGQLAVRRLMLSGGTEDQVFLYFWRENDTCIRCSTGIPPSALTALISTYALGSAFFALDLGEAYAALDPLTLFSSEDPALPILFAENSVTDMDSLLTALDFNPRTESRYTESNGTEVIVEGDRTLRIQPDYTIIYQSGAEPILTIPAEDDLPTAEESAAGIYQLLSQFFSGSGEELLCLTCVRQSGDRTTLEFEYLVKGATVRFSDGQPAATAELNGTMVDFFVLRLRQYSVSDQISPLLPRTQAAAIAQAQGSKSSSIHYIDEGGNSIRASWLAE